MKRLLLLLGPVATLVLISCSYGEVQPYRPPAYYRPPDIGADAVALGGHLYLRDCAFCHGSRGTGTEFGPNVIEGANGPALYNFVLRTGRMPVNAPVEQMMRNTPAYTEDEIRAIVTYMTREFRPAGPDIPHVDPARGDLTVGQQLYQEHCASCHATTGIGGAMLTKRGREFGGTAGIHIPGLEQSGALDIAEAIRTGPGNMPVFGPSVINDEELDAVVAYSLYLKRPTDAGGAPIGRVGPVVEGAVGWILGLGSLALFIRWMGTKAGERP
ncbi:MAG: c-type cytochrome [Actinomycetota bacterium]|nr:c-type cytochrome [Actinomycetota bacterium]